MGASSVLFRCANPNPLQRRKQNHGIVRRVSGDHCHCPPPDMLAACNKFPLRFANALSRYPTLLNYKTAHSRPNAPKLPRFINFNFNSQMGNRRYSSHNQQLLKPLRESIVDKPPYISGTLQLPESCFSFFYKTAKDGLAARFCLTFRNPEKRLFHADILVADILTLSMLPQTRWNSSLRPVNRLLLV